MGESDTGKEGFVQPNTMKDVVGFARKIAEMVADTEWVTTSDGRSDLEKQIHGLVLAIVNLPMRPVQGEHTLLYRLARAEAARLFGACSLFEAACNRLGIVPGSEVSLGDSKMAELDTIDDQLSSAANAFIAMAIDP